MNPHGASGAAAWSEQVILIGAICTGKSTVGRLLAMRLHVDYRSTDAMWSERATELGLDRALAERLWACGEYRRLYVYGKPFEVALLESLPAEPAVVEVGGTFTVQEDPVLAERCRAALRRHRHVVHLMASADPEENERVLYSRLCTRYGAQAPEPQDLLLWRISLDQRIAAAVATCTVDTANIAPEAVVEAILRAMLKA